MKIPFGETCYICGKKAKGIERNNSRVPTGKYICGAHYAKKYKYGTYEKPEKIYNEENRCEFIEEGKRCEERLYPKNAYRETGKDGEKTKIWFCLRHGYNSYQKNDPYSGNNTKKNLSDVRTGNQDPNSPKWKGDKFEELTKRWLRVTKLSEDHDNYTLPLDHSPIPNGTFVNLGDKLVDLSGKIPQTKGKFYDPYERNWMFGSVQNEWYKEFDIDILWCASKYGKKIERGYIIQKKDIYDSETDNGKKSIKIVNSTTGRYSIYAKYRITDEEEIKKINKIWTEI